MKPSVANHAMIPALVCVLLGACEEPSIEEYNRQQAERLEAKRPKGEAVKVDVALPGGGKIACDKIFSAEQMTQALGEREPVTVKDKGDTEIDPTSVCSVRRGGKMMGSKQQEEQIKKTLTLGVLAGDELCYIAAYCSIPADEDSLKNQCRSDQMKSNDAIGVYSCIKITPKGPHDAYTYQFIDPDSHCVMKVRGGPSVNEEEMVQKCAKAALDLMGPHALK